MAERLPEWMAVVKDEETGGRCMHKLIYTAGLPAKTRAMLRAEGDVLRALEHPNMPHIVQLREVQTVPGDEEHNLRLVLEYLPGGDLSSLLQRRKAGLPEATASALTKQLLQALAHCHARGIVHRDVNPGNVVLTAPLAQSLRRPVCKLIDFGFAARLPEGEASSDSMREVVGQAAYIAPEMLKPKALYSAKVDVWSAGALAFELLTGAPPFGREEDYGGFGAQERLLKRIRQTAKAAVDNPDVMKEHLGAEPSWTGLSTGAQGFLLSVLQVNPERRPAAEEAALHAWLAPACVRQVAGAATPQHRHRPGAGGRGA